MTRKGRGGEEDTKEVSGLLGMTAPFILDSDRYLLSGGLKQP
jgi:hypothetical protein